MGGFPSFFLPETIPKVVLSYRQSRDRWEGLIMPVHTPDYAGYSRFCESISGVSLTVERGASGEGDDSLQGEDVVSCRYHDNRIRA